MDACDLTAEDNAWSTASASGRANTTAPAADADVQIVHESPPKLPNNDVQITFKSPPKTVPNDPYKPLSYQQQHLDYPCARPAQQLQRQHDAFAPYRPLSSTAQSQAALCSSLAPNFGYEHQPQSAGCPSITNDNSWAHYSSSGCPQQPSSVNNTSSSLATTWQQQQYILPHSAPAADTSRQRQQQQLQWRPPSQQRPPSDLGYSRYDNSSSSAGGGSRAYSSRGYQSSGSWNQIRTGSPGGYNRSSRYNNGYNASSGRGGLNRYGSPGGFAAQAPSPRSQSGPQPWIKQGCWLVPRTGCSKRAAAASAGGHSALDTVAAVGETANAIGSRSDVGGKVVIIMRGLPGAGKSTRAAQLMAAAAAVASTDAATVQAAGSGAGCNCVIHSTDSYFINASGRYIFSADMLSINHQKNFEAFCTSVAAGVDMVIVDNTNIQPWQFEKYVTAAWQAGYRVREEIVGEFTVAAAAQYAARNTHGVPLDKILAMLDQWQL